MGRINVLGFDVANLIAAGEVVDRPASVVKELCENAIDAGATDVTVEIRHGGTTFIRVSDNGCGIEPDDMPLTVLRHATSKIATAEDLASIGTLGFRGEALAAIAAVCKLKILSRTPAAAMGCVMQSEGGEIVDIMETGCAKGTTVIASELFYNVPARRKFLKKDASECAAVTAVMEKIAMSSPKIAIKYITDGEIRFKTVGDGDLRGAIFSVFGKATASRMTPVDRTDANGIRVQGYIGEPDLVRANKNSENFFINSRFVKSRTAMAAVEQAFATRIPSQKFPVCVLNIKLNPAVVDVNVHPSKLEVKFANERIIFEAVYYAVLNALQNNISRPQIKVEPSEAREKSSFASYTPDTTVKSATFKPYTQVTSINIKSPDTESFKAVPKKDCTVTSQPGVGISSVKNPLNAFVPVAREKGEKSGGEQIKIEYENKIPSGAPKTVYNTAEALKDLPKDSTASEQSEESPPDYTIIGEAYNCYVIVQLEDRLLMIDKHAAHERILFDELCKKMKESERRGQLMLYPIAVRIDDSEAIVLEEYGEKIKAIGFDFHYDGKGELSVTEIPEELSRDGAVNMIEELLSVLAASDGSIETTQAKYFEAKLYQASCKAAIKGGRVYDEAHIRWICDRLLKRPAADGSVIKTCPHGRPVAFEIKKTSIERQFERLV